ncbi:hypothetical protein LA56_1526 [Francisella philomiragia]|uniref:hypothetical protein n=1 Tax=Francisella philomiragia TaxID=28110 RepID=UPI0005A561F9|nr:hypothetical protein [Francisella philomiragia]AJI55549.1 hypothetical protein LA56_1526 [Francisella philomiragia]MBK2253066.1 hypothetical protein [Francisella philomiragia]
MKKLIFLGIVLGLSNLYAGADTKQKWSDDYSEIKYVSASTLEALQKTRDANTIYPKIDEQGVHELYVSRPLSKYGLLGPTGPLGDSTHALKKIDVISLFDYDKYYKSFYGAFSEEGPLGFVGPFTAESYYGDNFYQSDSLAPHLRGLGILGVLGILGPLGPTGLLGPLGPSGQHNLEVDKDGHYLDKNKAVIKSIEVPFDYTETRVFDLFELYSADYALQNMDLDTSFAVEGSLKDKADDDYVIHSDQNQIVTIAVIPKTRFSIFSISLFENKTSYSKEKLIAKSDSQRFVNFIQFTAPKDTSYIVRIASPVGSDKYLLSVTGSTEYLNKYNVKGAHIKSYKMI